MDPGTERVEEPVFENLSFEYQLLYMCFCKCASLSLELYDIYHSIEYTLMVRFTALGFS